MGLAEKQCIPCKGDVPPLAGAELTQLHTELNHGWHLVNNHHLEKEFSFKDFKQALTFTNKVGALAEQQNHHPDVRLSWGKARITIYTHKIDGLAESDFIFAAKVEGI